MTLCVPTIESDMENRFFSLLIVPDSGSDVKTGSFNFKFVLGLFSGLIVLFLVCLFFIIGYHIKLSQEKNYKEAVSVNKHLLEKIHTAKQVYSSLSGRLANIQYNDRAYRNFNRMALLDDEMYKAGIGGHAIIDNSDYSALGEDLKIPLEHLDYGVTTLDRRIAVLNRSYIEIQNAVKQNRDIYNNTPSILPTHSFRFTSYFGWRTHPISKKQDYHSAVDIAGYRGQNIFATADGIVMSTKWQGPLGRCVKIKHGYGYETIYGHFNRIKVKTGQKVKKGDIIGEMGRTGNTTGVHVHYSILLNGKAQNPLDYF